MSRPDPAAFDDLDYLYDLGDIEIKMSGCMNACGHHHVGHIGILGVDKHGEEWYQITPRRLGQRLHRARRGHRTVGAAARGRPDHRAHRRGLSRPARRRTNASSTPCAASASQPFKEQRLCGTSCGSVSSWPTTGATSARQLRGGRGADRAARRVAPGRRSAGARVPGRLGVRLGPADRVEDLAAELPRLALVAVEFPNPGDGRGLLAGDGCCARATRFAGELRAVGAGVKPGSGVPAGALRL